MKVIAENPVSGEQVHTNTAYLVYVALDEQGNPTPVPPILAETPEDEARLAAGQQRQATRLTRQH